MAATKAQITITGNIFSTGSWETSSAQEDPVQEVLDDTKTALATNDSPTLYDLMSSDFKDLFGAENFTNTFNEGSTISAVTYLDTAQTLPSEWREQKATIAFSDGSTANYNLIFHLESDVWKLYATEDLAPE